MTAVPRLKLILAATCATVLALAAGAYAQGGTVKIDTEVNIRTSEPTFHGKVKADNENCVEDRKVKLFRKDSTNGGDRTLLGKTNAANNGKWKIPFDKIDGGVYFAVAKKVEQGTAGTIYECRRGKSKQIAIQ